MTYVFVALAILAFGGFAFNAYRRDGHHMVYSAVMVVIWIAAALWRSGAIG